MSSFKKRIFSAKNFKWIITFTLISILSIAVIFAFVKIDKNEKTKTLGTNSFTYAIGLLDAEGEYEQGTSSIYMKDYYSVDGLTVEIEDKATVTYKLFFYDADKEYIPNSATPDLSLNYDGSSAPVTAEYFRIMITPTNDAEVSFFEINNYASQLTVTINK